MTMSESAVVTAVPPRRPAVATDAHPPLDRVRYGTGYDVDIAGVRRYRLDRVRAQLLASDCGACVLGDPVNIRYATDSTNMQLWIAHNAERYLFVTADGPVILFDFHGSEHLCDGLGTVDEIRPAIGVYYYGAGEHLREAAAAWALEMDVLLREHAGGNRRLGVDRVHPYAAFELARLGIEVVDFQGPIEHARLIKSAAEVGCMRAAIAACQAGMRRMHESAHPGMTENELWSLLHQTNIELGGEWIETRLLTSGERTNPWMQECGFRVLNRGDMVSYDTDLIGPYGYCADLSRSFVVDARPSRDQSNLFAIARHQIEYNIDALSPGRSFREWAMACDTLPEGYRHGRYGVLAHGVGLCDEQPRIPYPDQFDQRGPEGVFEPGMTVCVESYVGADDGGEGVKLEQQVLITDSGIEVLSDLPLELATTA